METSPSQGVEVPMLADQDFEDMFLADTWARLGRVMLKEHDHIASLYSLPSDTKTVPVSILTILLFPFRFLPLLWYFQKMRNVMEEL